MNDHIFPGMMRFASGFVILFFLLSCQETSDRKIKLASADSSVSNSDNINAHTIKVADLKQKNIAVLEFKNETGNTSHDWLQRGITDMLITKLSQSSYLNVIPMNRITEISEKALLEHKHLNDRTLGFIIGREALAEIVITGKYYMGNDGIKIDVDMLNVPAEAVLNQETTSGSQLESIFSMVDVLSDKLFANMREKSSKAVDISEMTHSLEAFRCYSQALVNLEKLLYKEAETSLHDALAKDSTFAAALLKMAQVKINLGKRKESHYYLQLAQKHAQKLSEADVYGLRVLQAGINNDAHSLITILEEAVAKLPGDTDLRLHLARIYNELGMQDLALAQYNIVLDLDPHLKMAFNDLGYLYARRGDFKTGLSYIERYMELAPDEPNPYDSKGELLMMSGELELAIEQLHLALEKWPNFFYSSNRLSELYMEYGLFDQALNYLDIARKNSVKGGDWNIYFHVRKANWLWKANRIKEAEDVLKTGIHKYKRDPVLAFHLSELYRFLGDSVKMMQVENKLAKSFFRDPHASDFNEALFLYILKSHIAPERYINWLNQSLAVIEDVRIRTLANFTLAVLHARNANYSEAEKIIKNNNSQFYDLLKDAHQISWGRTWQYVNELVYTLSSQMDQRSAIYDILEKTASETDRQEIEIALRIANAQSVLSLGNQIDSEYVELGVPAENTWSLSGPFKAWDRSGFDSKFPPESVNEENEALWFINRDKHYDGYMNLRETFGDVRWSVGYGRIFVLSPVEQRVQIRLGCDEPYKLWLNNELIWKHYVKEGAIIDRDIVTVVLHQGYNTLLLKSLNSSFEWGFYLRVTDDDGNGIKNISFHPTDDVDSPMALQ
jgi:tetratricopeptide (TPR) repeat protein